MRIAPIQTIKFHLAEIRCCGLCSIVRKPSLKIEGSEDHGLIYVGVEDTS
jgi:hypothetical protein